jgi:hypothetical protein
LYQYFRQKNSKKLIKRVPGRASKFNLVTLIKKSINILIVIKSISELPSLISAPPPPTFEIHSSIAIAAPGDPTYLKGFP